MYTINPQPFSMAVSKMFLSLYDEDNTFQKHSTSWYPATSSSLFSILFDLAIFTPSNLNFFFYFHIFWNLLYILFWAFAVCSFPISDWLKTPVLLYFEKKSHMIHQKRRALSDFLKIIMINHNAQKSTDFLKFVTYDLSYMTNHVMYFGRQCC